MLCASKNKRRDSVVGCSLARVLSYLSNQGGLREEVTYRWTPSHPTGFRICSKRQQVGRALWALMVSSYSCFV